jgi:hypothetical protein
VGQPRTPVAAAFEDARGELTSCLRALSTGLAAVDAEILDLAAADLDHATALRRHLVRAAWLVAQAGRLLDDAADLSQAARETGADVADGSS